MKLSVTASIATLAVLGSASALALSFTAFNLGVDTELKSGTKELAKFNPDSFPTGGTTASGSVRNKHGAALPITDLDIDVDNGSSGNITIDGQSVPPDSNGNAHVNCDPGKNFNGTVNISIAALEPDDSGKDVTVDATPSYDVSISGGSLEVNAFPEHSLSRGRDQVRTGMAKCFHSGGVAYFVNDDAGHRINRIDGRASFPNNPSASVVDVDLQDTLGNSMAHTATITGNDFVIDGITPIVAGGDALVIVEWDIGLDNEPARLRLTGTFTP